MSVVTPGRVAGLPVPCMSAVPRITPQHVAAQRAEGKPDVDVKLESPWARLSRLHAELAETYAQMDEIQLAETSVQSDMDGAMPRASKRLLSAKDLAEMFGVDPKTIHRWRSEKVLPEAIEIRGVVRWHAPVIDRWIEESEG